MYIFYINAKFIIISPGFLYVDVIKKVKTQVYFYMMKSHLPAISGDTFNVLKINNNDIVHNLKRTFFCFTDEL